MSGKRRGPATLLHGLWLGIFALEAIVLREDPAEQISTALFAVLFTVLVVTEVRDSTRD